MASLGLVVENRGTPCGSQQRQGGALGSSKVVEARGESESNSEAVEV